MTTSNATTTDLYLAAEREGVVTGFDVRGAYDAIHLHFSTGVSAQNLDMDEFKGELRGAIHFGPPQPEDVQDTDTYIVTNGTAEPPEDFSEPEKEARRYFLALMRRDTDPDNWSHSMIEGLSFGVRLLSHRVGSQVQAAKFLDVSNSTVNRICDREYRHSHNFWPSTLNKLLRGLQDLGGEELLNE